MKQFSSSLDPPICCAVLSSSVVSTVCNPMDYHPPGSSIHGDSPGKNTGVGCHALLQGIFPTQGSNPGLLHCRWILYHLIHLWDPAKLESYHLKMHQYVRIFIQRYLIDPVVLRMQLSIPQITEAFPFDSQHFQC